MLLQQFGSHKKEDMGSNPYLHRVALTMLGCSPCVEETINISFGEPQASNTRQILHTDTIFKNHNCVAISITWSFPHLNMERICWDQDFATHHVDKSSFKKTTDNKIIMMDWQLRETLFTMIISCNTNNLAKLMDIT